VSTGHGREDQEAAPRLSWREAVYRFPPLRNALASGALLLTGLIVEWTGGPSGVALSLFVVAIVIGARYFAQEAFEELLEEREIGIEILMLLAAVGAMVFGLFEEAAALVFLYATAEAVEELTFARTRSAIRGLLDLAPKQAHLLRGGREELVPVEEVRPGDVFVVRAGEAVPTDGVIRSGLATLDEAPITGESVPVEKGPGQEVLAASVNGTKAIEVEATRPFEDNTLQRIVHLVEEAQAKKSRAQRFVDRFSTRYSPTVLAGGVALAVVPPLAFGGDWSEWILRGVTVLVAGAPCALVMSVPVAVAAAISRGGREGVLIKGGAQLEALGRIRAVCFDKTGTLTRGSPEVTDVLGLDGAGPKEVLALAAAVEQRSEHPLAKAIVERARAVGIEPRPTEDFEALVGNGARARLDGHDVWVGNPRLLADLAPTVELPPDVERLQAQGKTAVLVGSGTAVVGVVALRDEPRPEAKDALTALRCRGIRHIAMLTGDNERTARAIADQLGIEEVLAELKPEDKVEAVQRLRDKHGAIAMVGDGINDAPALAAADLGIAMGTAGSDAAIEAADIALMADDVTKVAEALRLGHRAMGISRQNLVFSIALLVVLIPSAAIGFLTVVVAVLVHEISELLAVANGVRAAQRPARAVPEPAA
jgi:heavy metal translocating P-type ATPase